MKTALRVRCDMTDDMVRTRAVAECDVCGASVELITRSGTHDPVLHGLFAAVGQAYVPERLTFREGPVTEPLRSATVPTPPWPPRCMAEILAWPQRCGLERVRELLISIVAGIVDLPVGGDSPPGQTPWIGVFPQMIFIGPCVVLACTVRATVGAEGRDAALAAVAHALHVRRAAPGCGIVCTVEFTEVDLGRWQAQVEARVVVDPDRAGAVVDTVGRRARTGEHIAWSDVAALVSAVVGGVG